MIPLAGLAALLVALATTGALIEPLRRRGMVDIPNQRSSHHRPTPRGGGLGVLLGLLGGGGVATSLGLPIADPALMAALLLVAAAGLADDIKGGVSRWARLVIQIGAGLLVVWRLGPLTEIPLPMPGNLPLGFAGSMAAIVWIVGFVNLTNFLDGIDGFAATQGLLAGAGLALAGVLRDSAGLTLTGALLACSCAGFLRFNWHPARVFLGDVGSSTIGFVLATSAWTGPAQDRSETVFLTAMLAWFFLADGSSTLLGRLGRREAFWEPHRLHLYQRLAGTGLTHSEVCWRILGLAALPAALAVAGYGLGSSALEWAALATGLVAFLLLRRQVVVREQVVLLDRLE